jgi:hypothetical protein
LVVDESEDLIDVPGRKGLDEFLLRHAAVLFLQLCQHLIL